MLPSLSTTGVHDQSSWVTLSCVRDWVQMRTLGVQWTLRLVTCDAKCISLLSTRGNPLILSIFHPKTLIEYLSGAGLGVCHCIPGDIEGAVLTTSLRQLMGHFHKDLPESLNSTCRKANSLLLPSPWLALTTASSVLDASFFTHCPCSKPSIHLPFFLPSLFLPAGT